MKEKELTEKQKLYRKISDLNTDIQKLNTRIRELEKELKFAWTAIGRMVIDK